MAGEPDDCIALVCDAQGLIVAVLQDGLPLDHAAVPGRSLTGVVAAESADESDCFLTTLRGERAAFDWTLQLPVAGVLTPFSFAGSALGECFLIVGARSRSALTALFERLLPQSSPPTQPESSLPKRAPSASGAVDELYNELSRVNNELATMHRELAKKNRQLTRALEELSQADQRKNEALARVAHELRNPLAPIQNTLSVLRRKSEDRAAVIRSADRIERQVTQMTRLIEELLDVTRVGEGKVEIRWRRLDLAQLARDVAEDRRSSFEAAGLALEAQIPAEPLWIDGDPGRLTQVTANLLQNALKFTDPGGRVTLRVGLDALASRAVVSVRDTGIGMAPELLPRIFDAFVQASQNREQGRGGVGLGLALVKAIVELHGGEVRAASGGPGQGSEFTVRLPLDRRLSP